MSQSIPYLLSQAIFQALGAAPELAGATFVDNPTAPAELADGERVVFIEDKGDAFIDRPGQSEGRTFSLTVGVINRTEQARAAADQDMEAVKLTLASSGLAAGRELVAQKRLTGFNAPREGQRGYRMEGLDVGGALIFTVFEIDYRLPAARRAGTAAQQP